MASAVNIICVLFAQEEDEECRVFAAAKRKMMRMRAEKEKSIHKYVIKILAIHVFITQ